MLVADCVVIINVCVAPADGQFDASFRADVRELQEAESINEQVAVVLLHSLLGKQTGSAQYSSHLSRCFDALVARKQNESVLPADASLSPRDRLLPAAIVAPTPAEAASAPRVATT